MTAPKLLALDFDGVICDTVREGCRSAWQVCREFVPLNGDAPPPELASRFAHLRPVVEHGWEFPVLVFAILDGIPEATIWESFQTACRERILEKYRVTPRQLAARFDAVRDRAIAKSLDDWLADQGLYPGMADRLRAVLASGIALYVITTKEGRFAHTLLETHGVTMPPDRVWGGNGTGHFRGPRTYLSGVCRVPRWKRSRDAGRRSHRTLSPGTPDHGRRICDDPGHNPLRLPFFYHFCPGLPAGCYLPHGSA